MRRLVVVLAIALTALPALAGERPTAEELIDRLKPQAVPAPTRGFVPRGITMEGGTKPVAQSSMDLEVNFEFNSAKLTTDAALTLDQLGRAMNDPALVPSRFQIAGHTDGVGGVAFNQILSEHRAAAVKNYLVARHHVAPGRLEAVGYGKSRLLDPADPSAAINRRVQVTNIGG